MDDTTAGPATIYVTYQGTPQTRFDRTYYVEKHMPLVARSWSKYGLEGAEAYFPATEATGTIALCELRFRDAAAVDAALGSPETAEVMADVSRYTDVQPALLRATPL